MHTAGMHPPDPTHARACAHTHTHTHTPPPCFPRHEEENKGRNEQLAETTKMCEEELVHAHTQNTQTSTHRHEEEKKGLNEQLAKTMKMFQEQLAHTIKMAAMMQASIYGSFWAGTLPQLLAWTLLAWTLPDSPSRTATSTAKPDH